MDTKWTQRFGILSHVVKNKPNEEEKTMKNYAYIDKQGILRVVSGEETARQYTANGKVVETTVPCKNGTPTLYNKALKAVEEVWVFGIFKAYWAPRE